MKRLLTAPLALAVIFAMGACAANNAGSVAVKKGSNSGGNGQAGENAKVAIKMAGDPNQPNNKDLQAQILGVSATVSVDKDEAAKNLIANSSRISKAGGKLNESQLNSLALIAATKFHVSAIVALKDIGAVNLEGDIDKVGETRTLTPAADCKTKLADYSFLALCKPGPSPEITGCKTLMVLVIKKSSNASPVSVPIASELKGAPTDDGSNSGNEDLGAVPAVAPPATAAVVSDGSAKAVIFLSREILPGKSTLEPLAYTPTKQPAEAAYQKPLVENLDASVQGLKCSDSPAPDAASKVTIPVTPTADASKATVLPPTDAQVQAAGAQAAASNSTAPGTTAQASTSASQAGPVADAKAGAPTETTTKSADDKTPAAVTK